MSHKHFCSIFRNSKVRVFHRRLRSWHQIYIQHQARADFFCFSSFPLVSENHFKFEWGVSGTCVLLSNPWHQNTALTPLLCPAERLLVGSSDVGRKSGKQLFYPKLLWVLWHSTLFSSFPCLSAVMWEGWTPTSQMSNPRVLCFFVVHAPYTTAKRISHRQKHPLKLQQP